MTVYRISDDMSVRSPSARALPRIDQELADSAAIVDRVGEWGKTPGLTADWSSKNLAAHLTCWRKQSVDQLEAAHLRAPDPPAPWPVGVTKDEEINNWTYRQNHNRSMSDVLAVVISAVRRPRSQEESMTALALSHRARFPWREGNAGGEWIASGEFVGHSHDEQEADLRRWLAAGRQKSS